MRTANRRKRTKGKHAWRIFFLFGTLVQVNIKFGHIVYIDN
jgi:hypothetical protein